MAISTFEGVVENGQIRLCNNVTLPENTIVYVVIPRLQTAPKAQVYSPRRVALVKMASARLALFRVPLAVPVLVLHLAFGGNQRS